jgi:glycosyltransferase involved in cell wall biosynthesis
MNSLVVRLIGTVEQMSCRFADGVIAVNETMRRRLLAKGVEGNKTIVMMNSPPPELAIQDAPAVTREDLGIAGGRSIVYMGGINRERDLTTLVRAVAQLQPAYHLRLILIGHGEDSFRAELVSLAEGQGLEGFAVRNRVRHTEAFQFMKLSDVGPVTYERNPLTELAMPTKALEYTAAGKPLVVANLPAIREIFADAALYYDPGDPSDLARQIARIFDEPQLARTLVTKGNEVLEKYSWSTMEARLVALYRRILHEAMFESRASRKSAS